MLSATCCPTRTSRRSRATGALLLVGVAVGLLRLRALPVGDLLPALVVAPLLTELVIVLR